MNLVYGLILTVAGGCLTGTSMLPIKWARRWKWENFWLLYTMVSLLILPAALAWGACPKLWTVYASLPLPALLRPFVFGSLWGLAYLGAGICVHRLGFAVQGALIGGIGTAVGTLAPLILQHANMLVQLSGLLIQAGTLITLAGVALCGWAGYHREQSNKQQGRRSGFSPGETAMAQAEPTRRGYFLAISVAVLSGLFAAFMNLALAYGRDIAEGAHEAGAASQWAPFAVWPIAFLGGSVVNLAYCVFLLSRNNTWQGFTGGLREVLNPALSACMWTGGVLLYSSATTHLGVLGVSIGFAMFFIVLMLCGQFLGVFTGEWKFVAAQIYRPFAVGCCLLVLAIFVFGASNFFST